MEWTAGVWGGGAARSPLQPLPADTAPWPPAPSALQRPPIKAQGKSRRRHRHLRLCALPCRPSKYQAVSPQEPSERCPEPAASPREGQWRGAVWHGGGALCGQEGSWQEGWKSRAALPQGYTCTRVRAGVTAASQQWVQCHRTQTTPGAIAGSLGEEKLRRSRVHHMERWGIANFPRNSGFTGQRSPSTEGKGMGNAPTPAWEGKGPVARDVRGQQHRHPRLSGRQRGGWGLTVGTCPGVIRGALPAAERPV